MLFPNQRNLLKNTVESLRNPLSRFKTDSTPTIASEGYFGNGISKFLENDYSSVKPFVVRDYGRWKKVL
jgi:hypothetical protein